MESAETPAKETPQPASAATPAPAFEASFNANQLVPRFWSVVQGALADAVRDGRLKPLDFGVYLGSQKQLDAFHADLDKRLSSFSNNL